MCLIDFLFPFEQFNSKLSKENTEHSKEIAKELEAELEQVYLRLKSRNTEKEVAALVCEIIPLSLFWNEVCFCHLFDLTLIFSVLFDLETTKRKRATCKRAEAKRAESHRRGT